MKFALFISVLASSIALSQARDAPTRKSCVFNMVQNYYKKFNSLVQSNFTLDNVGANLLKMTLCLVSNDSAATLTKTGMDCFVNSTHSDTCRDPLVSQMDGVHAMHEFENYLSTDMTPLTLNNVMCIKLLASAVVTFAQFKRIANDNKNTVFATPTLELGIANLLYAFNSEGPQICLLDNFVPNVMAYIKKP